MITKVDFSEASQFRRRSQKMGLVNQRAEANFYISCLRDPKMGDRYRQTYLKRLRVLRELLGEIDG